MYNTYDNQNIEKDQPQELKKFSGIFKIKNKNKRSTFRLFLTSLFVKTIRKHRYMYMYPNLNKNNTPVIHHRSELN